MLSLNPNSSLAFVLNHITSCSWYSLEKLPLDEIVSSVDYHGSYFILYLSNNEFTPIVCSEVSRSTYKRYGKKYRVFT